MLREQAMLIYDFAVGGATLDNLLVSQKQNFDKLVEDRGVIVDGERALFGTSSPLCIFGNTI